MAHKVLDHSYHHRDEKQRGEYCALLHADVDWKLLLHRT